MKRYLKVAVVFITLIATLSFAYTRILGDFSLPSFLTEQQYTVNGSILKYYIFDLKPYMEQVQGATTVKWNQVFNSQFPSPEDVFKLVYNNTTIQNLPLAILLGIIDYAIWLINVAVWLMDNTIGILAKLIAMVLYISLSVLGVQDTALGQDAYKIYYFHIDQIPYLTP